MPDARLDQLRSEAEAAIAQATTPQELEELRVKYLGRKSELTQILRSIATLPPEERGPTGKAANEARTAASAASEVTRRPPTNSTGMPACSIWALICGPAPCTTQTS